MARSIQILLVIFAGAFICHGRENDNDRTSFEQLMGEARQKGIESYFSVTNIYQQNVRGGISTHRRAGRLSGSYDFELAVDFEKLWGKRDSFMYILTEGAWPRTRGIDEVSVGSFQNVNGDAFRTRNYTRTAVTVTELWYKYDIDNIFRMRFGKLDLTGSFQCAGCPESFDGNAYANEETLQFLNNGLLNNQAIPFPDNGLGLHFHYELEDTWYAAAAAVDAKADIMEGGFNTAFDGDKFFFYIFEGAYTPVFQTPKGPMAGAYRIGFWIDAQDKKKFSSGKNVRHDMGLYMNFNQLVYKENYDPKDIQGLGLFGRYGAADSDLNNAAGFWSLGFQYEGLFEGRDNDILGFGMAQVIFSDQPGANEGKGFSDDSETAFEMYYALAVSGNMIISPSVQYISNPDGDRSRSDAVVLGGRLQLQF